MSEWMSGRKPFGIDRRAGVRPLDRWPAPEARRLALARADAAEGVELSRLPKRVPPFQKPCRSCVAASPCRWFMRPSGSGYDGFVSRGSPGKYWMRGSAKRAVGVAAIAELAARRGETSFPPRSSRSRAPAGRPCRRAPIARRPGPATRRVDVVRRLYVVIAWPSVVRASPPPPCFSTMLITPAIASEPYCAAAPSRRISMRSIMDDGIALRSTGAEPRPTKPLTLTSALLWRRLPLTSTSVWSGAEAAQRGGTHVVGAVADRRARKVEARRDGLDHLRRLGAPRGPDLGRRRARRSARARRSRCAPRRACRASSPPRAWPRRAARRSSASSLVGGDGRRVASRGVADQPRADLVAPGGKGDAIACRPSASGCHDRSR